VRVSEEFIAFDETLRKKKGKVKSSQVSIHLQDKFVLLLLGFILDLSAFEVTEAGILVLRFFFDFFVAFHVLKTTNPRRNVSDHEKLRAPTNI
jgi:hypothetical protein